jgi:hypothetical protein
MRISIAALAAVVGLCAAPVFAAEQQPASAGQPQRLTDGQLDQVKGGDPLIYVGIMAPINVHIEPITVNVPINVAAVVQANVLGNGAFQALAVGTQNNYNFGTPPVIPGG